MSDYDWIIGISVSLMIAIYLWKSDDNNTGLLIILFLNIGFVVMVYAGMIEIWILILNLIFSIFIIYIASKARGIN